MRRIMTISSIASAARTYILANPLGDAATHAPSAPGEPLRGGKLPTLVAARPTDGNEAEASDKPEGPIERMLRQLQKQLELVLKQIQRLQASRLPEDQKQAQLRTLSNEAMALQRQIVALQKKQLEARTGSITA